MALSENEFDTPDLGEVTNYANRWILSQMLVITHIR